MGKIYDTDLIVERLFEDGRVGTDWVSAKDIADLMGYDDVPAFKTVVWSLTRLTLSGRLQSRVVNYPVPYRRGSGEERREYRLARDLPQYLQPQALRK